MLANLVSRDISTTTGANLRYIEDSTFRMTQSLGDNPSLERQLLRKRLSHLSQCMTWTLDRWRIPLLDMLLATSENMEYMGMEEKEVSRMIDSLCIN